AGLSYNWSVTGSGAVASGTTGQSFMVQAGTSGSFTVNLTVTDANGCSSTCSKMVSIYTPVLGLEVVGPTNANCGDMLGYAVKVTSNFVDVMSLQYSINWDQTKLSYVAGSASAVNIGGPGTMCGGTPCINVGANNITYSWADPSGFDGED